MSKDIASLVKIPCYLLKLSSRNENMGVSRADNSVKIWQNLPISNPKPDLLNVNAYSMSRVENSVKIWRNLPISNPKPDLHNINAHTKFGENPLIFTQVIIRKQKTDGWTDGHTNIQHELLCLGGGGGGGGYKNPQMTTKQTKLPSMQSVNLTICPCHNSST